MKDYRVIWEQGNHRIIEILDDHFDVEDLKGDMFNPRSAGVDPAQLKLEEREFEALVNSEGVYGYELQKWNPDVGLGWKHVDSCFGFVGQYEAVSGSRFNHYIVDEMKTTAKGNV